MINKKITDLIPHLNIIKTENKVTGGNLVIPITTDVPAMFYCFIQDIINKYIYTYIYYIKNKIYKKCFEIDIILIIWYIILVARKQKIQLNLSDNQNFFQ